MMLVKLTELEDGSIRAESSRQVIGYFDDMSREDVIEYLVNQAEQVGEQIRFVDELEEREEPVSIRHLMKGKRKK
jgi:hypothetical protein